MASPSKTSPSEPSLRDRLLGKLSRREHSVYELRQFAKQKGYPIDEIQPVLDEFIDMGWVNDQRFSDAFCRHRLSISRWAPARIVQGLLAKGVAKDIAQQTVRAHTPEDLTDSMKSVLRKKNAAFLRESDLRKRKKKIVDYLLRKGYAPGDVYDSADSLLNSLTE